MIPPLERIVVAVDGSDESLKAVDYALKLAEPARTMITILRVVLLPTGASEQTLQAVKKDMWAKGNVILSRAQRSAELKRDKLETQIVETDHSVVMAIVDYARQEKADLIILGTKGTSGFGRLMLGSTAAGTVSLAPCSVLTVR